MKSLRIVLPFFFLFLATAVAEIKAQSNALKKLADITDALTTKADPAPQDTTKKNVEPSSGSNTTQNSGTQSNLAVTDEGAPADKPKSENKKLIENPIEKIKVKNTQKAAQNQGSGAPTSNLAVTDEGVGADKTTKGKTNKQSTSGNPAPAQGTNSTVSPR